MKQSKILIICPEYEPSLSGLAGYTSRFAEELAKHHRVSLLTSKKIPKTQTIGSSIEIYPSLENWGFLHLAYSIREIKEINPDRILIQYLPFLYSPRGGIHFGICFFVMLLRFYYGFKIDLMCHELNHPPEWKIKSLIMFVCHSAMLLLIGNSAEQLFSSTQYFDRILKRIFFWKRGRVHYLPVGSNIKNLHPDKAKIKKFKEENYLENKFVIACFGTLHPSTNYSLVFRSINELSILYEVECKILFIGQKIENLHRHIPEILLENISNSIFCLGQLDDENIVTAMSCADVFVSYFCDGVSARRGTIMAALQLGIPSITSANKNTDSIFYQIPLITLLSSEPKLYTAQLTANLLKLANEKKENMKNRGLPSPSDNSYFQEHFSWSSIVSKYCVAICEENLLLSKELLPKESQ